MDVLQVIPDDKLSALQDIYKNLSDDMDHIFNYLSTVIKWKVRHPESEYYTILAPNNWKETGTFIGVNRYFCNELFIATTEEDCQTLHNAIAKTKRIDWTEPWLVYSMYGRLYPYVIKTFEEISFDVGAYDCANIWRVSKEKAADFVINCPDDVFIAELQEEHAKIINTHWPPRYTNSQYYLAAMIQINGGYGVFLKSNNQLIAWVIQNTIGLGAIQTLNGFSRKGYGSLVTMYLSKKIAEEGINPLGTVKDGNVPSEKMFLKMGFEKVGTVVYIDNQLMLDLENAAK